MKSCCWRTLWLRFSIKRKQSSIEGSQTKKVATNKPEGEGGRSLRSAWRRRKRRGRRTVLKTASLILTLSTL